MGAFGNFLKDTQEKAEDAYAGAASFTEDVTGAEEFANSEQADEFRRQMADAKEEGGISGAAKMFDTGAKAGFDFVLDNPNGSVQDTAREGIEAATGVDSEDQGEAAADLAGDVQSDVQNATEDTPLDNPVTDAVSKGFEVFVADPAKAGVRGTTGISIDSGSTEGTVGAADAFDAGVTVATAGTGKVATGAARAASKSDEAAKLADEGGSLLKRALGRGGDEAASKSDEAAQAADESGTLLADGGTDVFNPRNLPVLADEAASKADEAASAADDAPGLFASAGASLSDEAAKLADEGGSLVKRTLGRGGDEAAKTTDEAAQAADESSGAVRRMLGTTSGKVAAGTGAALAGGALLETLGTFDRLEVTDPKTGESYALVREKDYQPTEKRDGGILWQVQTGTAEAGYTNAQGFTVMVGASGRNVYVLDENGNRTRAQVPVDTFNEAIQRAKGTAGGNGGAA